MPPAPARRRFGVALTVGALALSTVAAVPQAAYAATPEALIGSSQAAGTASTVTLITGDRVEVTFAADGTPSAFLESGVDHYTRRVGDDLYVIPVSAEHALAQGRLDLELFNVTGLVRQGYDDTSRTDLPLIVTGSLPQTRGLTGLSAGTPLGSIDATAVTATKENLAATYAALVGDGNARSVTSTGKIWLDAKVEGFDLDDATGVEQTGAPDAWDLGYDGTGTKVAILDTGYDMKHPDLAGQVIAAEDFTGSGSAADTAGHGTHVASTIAGTGASDASRVGMAPGADLLIGRVLGNGGGQISWIVAGMEWAVAQGADVVNMSLGSSLPTDCTDPMAEAATALSAQSKTLFVVAAGNAGMRETVSSPGCVEGVLTVGAVDSEGATADFSSRGPVLGNHNLKPDLTAPGVGIVGAANGSPGGIDYRTMSGTSMATPHVVGAVALIRQAHPDWTAQQVKAALVASVKRDTAGTVYEQGAGELWVPGAIGSTVVSDASVRIDSYDWPHGRDERTTRDITYTNNSDHAITLDLELGDVTGADGEHVPSSAFHLGADQVTVPAHGTATVPVTARGDIHVDDDAYGEIGARVTATGHHGVRVTTAVGFWLEPETVTLTVKGIDRNGVAATNGYLDIVDMHQPTRELYYFSGEDTTLRVRAGSYSLTGFIRTTTTDGTYTTAYVGNPDARIDEDTVVTLDARDANPVTVSGDRAMAIRSGSIDVHRTFDRWTVGNSVYASNGALYAAPTGRVHTGEFHYGAYVRAYDPAVTVEDSAYVYNLAFASTNRVEADQSHKIRDRKLATVTEHWYGQRTDSIYTDTIRMVREDGTTPVYAGGGNPVRSSATRTAYYTPDVAWQQIGSTRKRFADNMFDKVRTYQAGQRSETDWFKLATNTAIPCLPDGSPGRIAERQGTLMGAAFSTWQDTVDGRWGVGAFGDIGGMDVYKNGKSLGHSAWPMGQVDVGSDTAKFRIQVMQIRTQGAIPGLYTGLGTISRFDFTSGRPEGESIAALPVALPRYDADVDQRNLAPATTDFGVGVSLHGQDGYDPGAITSFTAKVTFEQIDLFGDKQPEEYTWTEVPVVQRDGRWVALVDNSAHPGKYASLWINTVDSHGSATEQFTLNLYGVA